MNVTAFKNIYETKNGKVTDTAVIFERIRNGANVPQIEKIRALPTKKERDELKKYLPVICFSGLFTERNTAGFRQHTGLIALDFDHVQNIDDAKAEICADPFTFAAFTSPSGDGLKVIVKIPDDPNTHADSLRALQKHFNIAQIDELKDLARACYESYDPEIYVNENSQIFTDKIPQLKPGQVFQNLKKWIEKTDTYHDGNKYNFLVKFTAALNRFGISQPDAAKMLQNEYQNAATFVAAGDFEKITEKIYKSYLHQHATAYFDGQGKTVLNDKTEYKAERLNDYVESKEPKKKDLTEAAKILEKHLIDFDKPYTAPTAIYSIRDSFVPRAKRLFTLGNISTITGKAKSKKTFLMALLAGGLVANREVNANHIVNMPKGKQGVLVFDTEQSEYDSYLLASRIKQVSKTAAENLGVYSLRGKSATEIMELIEAAVQITQRNLGVIFIDQSADLVSSLNDEEAAVAMVKFLERLTNDYNIHICCVIHQNKANDYAQGWLGTQLIKKSETIISVTKYAKSESMAYVESYAGRGASFEPFFIEIRENEHGHALPYLLCKQEAPEAGDYN